MSGSSPLRAVAAGPLKITGFASVNGVVTAIEDAKISILDRALQFGHGLFETVLVYRGKLVTWKDHIARLESGCKRILISPPAEPELYSTANLLIAKLIEHEKGTPEKIQLRILISGGASSGLGLPKGEPLKPHVMVLCRKADAPPKTAVEKGFALKSIADARAAQLVDIKSCNYLWNFLSLEEARCEGFDDALFINSQGECTESTTATFLWVDEKGNFSTMPPEGNTLPGTTVKTLERALSKARSTQLTGSLRIPEFDFRSVTMKKLRSGANREVLGCAIISSVRGLVPVRRIDDIEFDVGKLKSLSELANELLLKEYACEL